MAQAQQQCQQHCWKQQQQLQEQQQQQCQTTQKQLEKQQCQNNQTQKQCCQKQQEQQCEKYCQCQKQQEQQQCCQKQQEQQQCCQKQQEQQKHHEVEASNRQVQGHAELIEAASSGNLQNLVYQLSFPHIRQQVNTKNSNGWTALHFASGRGNLAAAERLVAAGALPDLPDAKGYTALIWSAANGHREIAKLLLGAQADPNRLDYKGMSPLYVAALRGHDDIVHLLLAAGASAARCQQLPDDGRGPLHAAAGQGHTGVIRELLAASADPNLPDKLGHTPVHAAALRGHCESVRLLLAAGGSAASTDAAGWTPADMAAAMGHWKLLLHDKLLRPGDVASVRSAALAACRFGNHEVLARILGERYSTRPADIGWMLSLPGFEGKDDGASAAVVDLPVTDAKHPALLWNVRSGCELSPSNVSLQLHHALNSAGFVAARAAFQSALSSVMEQILRRMRSRVQLYLVGSYSEGWGSSMESIDGRIDIDSDMDVTQILQDRIFHLVGHCKCDNKESSGELVKYEEGHVRCFGSASSPRIAFFGSAMRPAVDWIYAYRCCCYPTMEKPARISAEQLTQLPCHLVTAASPGKDGQQLRVSTVLIERHLLRNMTTVQGQVFVLLKHLIKKVISERASGLKTYHAKTLMLRLLERFPDEQWKAERLVDLAAQALQELLSCLLDSAMTGPDKCMRHFFLRDAFVYLKGVHASKAEIADAVRSVIGELPMHAVLFATRLRPVANSGRFQFHPFVTLPYLFPEPVVSTGMLEYHQLYYHVRILLLQLAGDAQGEQFSIDFRAALGQMPDCASTARLGLEALLCLKLGTGKAELLQVLSQFKQLQATSVPVGILCPSAADSTSLEDAVETIWQHLTRSDSTVRFCIDTEQRLQFAFLPERIAAAAGFPCRLENTTWSYVNFEVLLWCLCFDEGIISPTNCRAARLWFEATLARSDADAPALLAAMEHCTDDRQLLARLIARHRRVVCDQMETRLRVVQLMGSDSDLLRHMVKLTVEEAANAARLTS